VAGLCLDGRKKLVGYSRLSGGPADLGYFFRPFWGAELVRLGISVVAQRTRPERPDSKNVEEAGIGIG
ncbi:MAG: hypothetical protein AAGG69_16350, partial [Pseudomonadota bacterium]